MKESEILLIQERTVLELFNDTIKFIIQNFKILIQLFLVVSLPFIIITTFLAFAPSSLIQSSLYQDVSQIIYLQKQYVGFNAVYLILIGTSFSTLIYSFIDLSINNPNKSKLTLNDIYNHLKPNFVALISLAFVSTIIISLLLSVLIELDTEFQDAFVFSIFYLIYLVIPIIIYFYLSIIYLIVNKQLAYISAFEKVKSYFDEPKQVIISVVFVIIIIFLLKYILNYITFFIIAILSIPVYENLFGFILNTSFELVYMALIVFTSIYIAFLYNSQVARHEGNELMKLIDNI